MSFTLKKVILKENTMQEKLLQLIEESDLKDEQLELLKDITESFNGFKNYEISKSSHGGRNIPEERKFNIVFL